MKKFTMLALAFVLTASLMTGCRRNVMDGTSNPSTNATTGSTQATTHASTPSTTATAPSTTATNPSTTTTTPSETTHTSPSESSGATESTDSSVAPRGHMMPRY